MKIDIDTHYVATKAVDQFIKRIDFNLTIDDEEHALLVEGVENQFDANATKLESLIESFLIQRYAEQTENTISTARQLLKLFGGNKND